MTRSVDNAAGLMRADARKPPSLLNMPQFASALGVDSRVRANYRTDSLNGITGQSHSMDGGCVEWLSSFDVREDRFRLPVVTAVYLQ